ncbi:hypothetical protein TNCV_998311 [Trichonephila clavipes]|nr:hypothetical protein TNCV_998311 [Trichonephila clavipes]
MEVKKEKIWYILQFFFEKGENSSHAAEIVNGVYGLGTVTANYVQFWFRRFRSEEDSFATAPVQVQSISPSSSGRRARFLGGQKGVALQLQDARVGVGSTKKPTRC